MAMNEYWNIVRLKPGLASEVSSLKIENGMILELTEDGLAYIWPSCATYEYLCQNCIRAKNKTFPFKDCLKLDCTNSIYPCNFVAAGEIDHQDFDSYLIEGDCYEAGGYYSGINDFIDCHLIDREVFSFKLAGSYEDISQLRELCKVYKYIY